MIAHILTPWVDGGFDSVPNPPNPDIQIPKGLRPAVADDYNITRWEDATAQPGENLTPSPNAYVIKAWVDETTLAAIEADNNYTVLMVE